MSKTMTKQSLYNINNQQRELINQIEELEGEITPEVEQQLMITQKDLQIKSIAYLEFMGSLEAFNAKASEEIKRLQALVKRNNNISERLKSVLLDSVKTFGEYETPLHKFGTRKSTQTVIDSAEDIPNEFIKKTVTTRPDKTAIKKALQKGQKVPGARLKEQLNLKIS